ncbi:hypothetical protein [Mycobacterium sp. SMC-4]|uniref:hypothetical protein n=1 Tax=Mycobacterium sp. SMC-4 TaxID=2857059 RepID=UPI0021B2766E|nr:hypothetical protein [Mycobacterium sp. SMC-4]UXA17322.1 hypothetical protein KXD98_21680 [Mycobacterium sp. SMC-4]
MAPIAILAMLVPLSAILALVPTAAAQPVPPVDPPPAPPPVAAPPPPPAHPLFPLAQSGSPVGVGGLPPGLTPFGPPGAELALGQHPVPSAPGTAPVAPPNLNPLNNQYLLPQHLVPSAPGEGEMFGVEPGREHADVGAADYLRRLWETYQAGGLDGALLGQRPLTTLNQPLEPPAPAVPPGG